jgi:hypothetical protein
MTNLSRTARCDPALGEAGGYVDLAYRRIVIRQPDKLQAMLGE